MNNTADTVIIGGGINGCCTAYYLAKSGVKNIILLEKDHIASGPTGRSSGIVRQHYSQETLAAMARDSVQVWQNFEEQIGGSASFVTCGSFCSWARMGLTRSAKRYKCTSASALRRSFSRRMKSTTWSRLLSAMTSLLGLTN